MRALLLEMCPLFFVVWLPNFRGVVVCFQERICVFCYSPLNRGLSWVL